MFDLPVVALGGQGVGALLGCRAGVQGGGVHLLAHRRAIALSGALVTSHGGDAERAECVRTSAPCWRHANSLLTDRQQLLDSPYGHVAEFSRLDPGQRRDQILDAANALFAERAYDEVSVEDIANSADVTRGLVHHYFGGRKEVYIALLERLGAQREERLRPPVGRSARARVADTVSRWLDWTEANRTIWLATIARGEDIADPEVRRVVADLVRRAVTLLAAHHADIAEDSPRLRYALECWTGLNRAATRRWLHGEATREATHELLASTLEHVLRTFGARPPRRRASPP